MISLSRDDVALNILPYRGGGVAHFTIAGTDIFRPLLDDNDCPTALASFPLLPFSGRIDQGQFVANGETISLRRNFPAERLHAIHGHGWQAEWHIVDHTRDLLLLRYDHSADDWPWPYVAHQHYRLTDHGYRHELAVQNLGDTAMPVGLGLHPFFPRAGAEIKTQFTACWAVDAKNLPLQPIPISDDVDWFGGTTIDTVFEGATGTVEIAWPTHSLVMRPDADLNRCVIYVPSGENYFCVEPVSHVPNAINHGSMRWLEPGKSWSVGVDFGVTLGTELAL
jgi:aldose 1-epimerase